MAYNFGSGINPQLGLIDYSPIARGAQAGAQMAAQGNAQMWQGIGSALGDLGKAYGQYKENQKIAAVQMRKIEAAAQSDPTILQKAPESVQKLFGKMQKDGTLNIRDASQLGAYIDSYKADRLEAAQWEELQRQKQLRQQSAAYAALMQAGGGQAPFNANSTFSPEAQMQGGMQYAQLRHLNAQSAQAEATANAKENPLSILKTQAEIAKLQAEAGKLGQPPAMTPGEQERIRLEQERLKLQQGEFSAKQATAQQAEADKQVKFEARLNKFRSDLAQTVDNVNQAINLVSGGAGGPLAGLPGVRDVNAVFGSAGAKNLASLYASIGSSLKLSELASLKELSPTGASGLGQLSDREGAALESRVAELNPSLPESEQLKKLQTIKQYLLRLGVPAQGAPTKGRFTIISSQ